MLQHLNNLMTRLSRGSSGIANFFVKRRRPRAVVLGPSDAYVRSILFAFALDGPILCARPTAPPPKSLEVQPVRDVEANARVEPVPSWTRRAGWRAPRHLARVASCSTRDVSDQIDQEPLSAHFARTSLTELEILQKLASGYLSLPFGGSSVGTLTYPGIKCEHPSTVNHSDRSVMPPSPHTPLVIVTKKICCGQDKRTMSSPQHSKPSASSFRMDHPRNTARHLALDIANSISPRLPPWSSSRRSSP